MALEKLNKDECCDSAHKLGAKVRALYDSAEGEVHELTETIEQRIKAKPVQSSMIALGAGLLLGLLLNRR